MSRTLKTGLILLGIGAILKAKLFPLGPCSSVLDLALLLLCLFALFAGSVATIIGLLQFVHHRLRTPRATTELHL